MFAYFVRRILYTIPVMMGVALIVFLLFNVSMGDPAQLHVGKHASPEQIQEVRESLGLNKPLVWQFIDYLRQIVTLDFGRSWATHQSIDEMILEGLGPTVSLTLPAFFIGVFIAIGLGLLVAFRRGSQLDKWVVVICVLGMSAPALALILFGQYFLGYQWGLFPIGGYEFGLVERWAYLALPILIFILIYLGQDVRFFRTAMLDEMNQDYIRTAKAKGLGHRKVLFKHLLKNALIPIITYVVIVLPYLILGSILLESFFSIPGLGGLLITALNNADFPVVKAMTTVLSFLTIFFTLLTDLLYALVDPRVSLG